MLLSLTLVSKSLLSVQRSKYSFSLLLRNEVVLLIFYVLIVSQTRTQPVQMMFLRDTFLIFQETTMKFQVIELPYVENEVSMFILLPDDISDNTTGLELVKLTSCCITHTMRH